MICYLPWLDTSHFELSDVASLLNRKVDSIELLISFNHRSRILPWVLSRCSVGFLAHGGESVGLTLFH
ncbi:unnamed protein product [Acidithrix sp. C25]|nr:unnamed protein product [Acidithrix sp. C25]